MNVSIFCLSLGVPGAGRTVSNTFPGWPEVWNLLVSVLLVSLFYLLVSRIKGQETQRRREKVVPFPASSRVTSRPAPAAVTPSAA